MARFRRRRRRQEHVATDLEIMPMINVFMAIIPLLLMSAAFVQVTVIQATLPSSEAAAEPPPAEAPLDLTIIVRGDGYLVRANGVGMREIARPDEASGEAAREQLAQMLAEIVGANPGHRDVMIVAEPSTKYDEIIAIMDVTRAAGLPEATLADASLGIS
jgi:biopolymer transport protein ExbD